MIRGKLALMPAMSRIRPAWPPMNTNPSWMRIGNRTSSGTETQGADPSRATTQAMPIPTAAPPSTVTASPIEVEPLRRPRDGARHDDPGDADGDVRRGQPAGAVRVEEHRVGDDAQQRGHRPEQQRLRRQPRDGAARGARDRRHGAGVTWRRVGRFGRLRPRSGSLADHRDERGDDPARERRPVGEQLVEQRLVDPQQHRRLERGHGRGARLGHERRQLADRRAGPEGRQRLVAAVDAEPARPRSRTGGPRPRPPR